MNVNTRAPAGIPMRRPSKQILIQHEDGRWYRGGLLDQYRSRDGWSVVVTYTTASASTYVMAMPSARCRALVPD
jgi:hypothetical protein